jgi:hypothetical protein
MLVGEERMQQPEDRNEHPEFLGPGYDLAAFRRDLTGGGLRWHSTILAAASGGLLAGMIAGLAPMVIPYPIHAEGPVVMWIVGAVLLLWTWLAILNWWGWIRNRDGGRERPPG